MLKKSFGPLLVLTIALTGCSSKPDISDIQAPLQSFWADCPGVTLTDIQKTNGVDKGSSYEMSVSYKLKFSRDMTAQEAWRADDICPSYKPVYQAYYAVASQAGMFDKPVKAGDIIPVSASFEMIKSEKGWIIR